MKKKLTIKKSNAFLSYNCSIKTLMKILVPTLIGTIVAWVGYVNTSIHADDIQKAVMENRQDNIEKRYIEIVGKLNKIEQAMYRIEGALNHHDMDSNKN